MRGARGRPRPRDGRARSRASRPLRLGASKRSTAAIVPATSFTRSTTRTGAPIVVDEETARLLDYAAAAVRAQRRQVRCDFRRACAACGVSTAAIACRAARPSRRCSRSSAGRKFAGKRRSITLAARHGDRFRRHRQGVRGRSRCGARAPAVVALLAQLRRRSRWRSGRRPRGVRGASASSR